MRRSLVAALSLVAATAACTSLLGDFTLAGSGGGPDGSPGDEAGDDGPTVLTVTAVPVVANVYFGATATLDGTQSSATTGGLGYSWSLLSKPEGSNLGDGTIGGANTATARLKPDVVGEYVLALTVTSTIAASMTNTARVTLYCGLPQVFYAQGTAGTQVSASYDVASLDGGGARPVLCPDTAPSDPVSGTDIPAFASYAGRAYDFWEAPPLDPMVTDGGPGSRLAAFTVDYVAGSGYTTHLWGASSTSACDAGVTDYAATGFGYGKPFGSEPRFRPDGQRFAVLDAQWNILSYAWGTTSGTNGVAAYPIQFPQAASLDPSTALGATGGILQGYFQEPPQVEWMATPVDGGAGGSVDGGGSPWQLAWAVPRPTSAGGAGWAIVTAPDQSHAPTTTYMECAGIVPRQFAVLADGSVIASYRQTATGAEDLVHLSVVDGACKQITNYTNLPPQVASIATDFAISPDGAAIAFLRFDPTEQPRAVPWALNGAQLPGGHVYAVPVGGDASGPTRLTPEPAIYGPRWIGGGTQIVFTRLDGANDAGNVATSVVTIPAPACSEAHCMAAGTTPSIVVQGDGVTTFVSTNGNAACGIGSPRTSGGVAGLLGGLVGLAGIARRRRT